MSFQSRVVASVAFFVLILCGSFSFPTQASTASPKIDRVLMEYFKSCRANVNKPGALEMCDTLFHRAKLAGDERMQVMALYARLDCFYLNDANPILVAEAVEKVQEFCRTHNWPQFIRYYYSVSFNRLVKSYMSHNQANAAVYETCRMLAQAQNDNYPQGLVDCYRTLAEIYFSQSDFRLAYDNYGLSIECMERHNLSVLPLTAQYASRAECALELDMPDSAAVLIRRGYDASLGGAYSAFVIHRVSMLYYLYTRNYEKAKEVLTNAELLFVSDRGLKAFRGELYVMRANYYIATKDYSRALEAAFLVRNDTDLVISVRDRDECDKLLGDIYFEIGAKAKAVDFYRNYIFHVDSLRVRESRLAANDLSSILEIVRLQNETKELQLNIQVRRLHNTYAILFVLVMVVILATLIAVRTMQIVRKLKRSEQHVVAQNVALKIQGEELLHAKEAAELASRMKSAFIQNMSHEVRTPLNSIVGFSQVLASQFRKDTSTVEYAAIIESSSFNLIRLVDDVLDIAALDQIDSLPLSDYCELNSCCRDCADRILLQLNPTVSLVLEPSKENPKVSTNVRRITQIIMQLLHNAAKFTRSGQIVLSYTCLTDERLLRFVVSDTGPGIPRDQQEKVFERFVKLDDFSQGTGLGLSVCRIIAEKMCGTIRIDDTYSGGCSFILELPFIPTDPKA